MGEGNPIGGGASLFPFLCVCVFLLYPIIATRRLLRLRAPEGKEGPGNLSLVFLLFGLLALSLPLSFLYITILWFSESFSLRSFKFFLKSCPCFRRGARILRFGNRFVSLVTLLLEVLRA